MQPNVANEVFRLLHDFGIKYVFGIPGDELEIFHALGHSKLQFVTTRHEQGGAFMAQAVGKLTSLPGVCISTLGPGATNLVTAVADAYQSRVPLIVLSGQLETIHHKPVPLAHQYVDLTSLFGPITKRTFVLNDPAEVVQTLSLAFKTAMTGRPGPVHITLPVNIMECPMAERQPSIVPPAKKTALIPPEEEEKIVKLLGNSKYPVAFFGPGAQKLHPSFLTMLMGANIPVITSLQGKGSFPELHPLSLGTISRHVKDKLKDVISKTDLFLVIDYDYIEGVQPALFAGKKVIALGNESVNVEHLITADAELIGDITDLSQKLSETIGRFYNQSMWKEEEIVAVRKERYKQILAVQDYHSYPYNPYRIWATLQKMLKGDEIVVSDVGNHKQALALGLRITKPYGIHFSNGLSSMGFSLPFAAGLRFATGAEPSIISVSGDGGFLMNVQELETISRYNLNLKIIVLVDNAFGMIKTNLLTKYRRVKNLNFTNPDFEMLAKSFYLDYLPVDRHNLSRQLKRLLSAKKSTLMTIPVKYS